MSLSGTVGKQSVKQQVVLSFYFHHCHKNTTLICCLINHTENWQKKIFHHYLSFTFMTHLVFQKILLLLLVTVVARLWEVLPFLVFLNITKKHLMGLFCPTVCHIFQLKRTRSYISVATWIICTAIYCGQLNYLKLNLLDDFNDYWMLIII